MKLSTALVQELDRKGRCFSSEIEVRSANADGSIPFRGHAALFSRRYSVYGMWLEEFAPGAFSKTIQEADVRALINHDPNMVLAGRRAAPSVSQRIGTAWLSRPTWRRRPTPRISR